MTNVAARANTQTPQTETVPKRRLSGRSAAFDFITSTRTISLIDRMRLPPLLFAFKTLQFPYLGSEEPLSQWT